MRLAMSVVGAYLATMRRTLVLVVSGSIGG
jgi:hypothetical protein